MPCIAGGHLNTHDSRVLKEDEVKCFMCLQIMAKKRVRDHVARHIVRALYGEPEKGLYMQVCVCFKRIY